MVEGQNTIFLIAYKLLFHTRRIEELPTLLPSARGKPVAVILLAL
jgi:hypothetical protein